MSERHSLRDERPTSRIVASAFLGFPALLVLANFTLGLPAANFIVRLPESGAVSY